MSPFFFHLLFLLLLHPSRPAAIVVQASDTTWQAYNTYGGTSTYGSYKEEDPRPRFISFLLFSPCLFFFLTYFLVKMFQSQLQPSFKLQRASTNQHSLGVSLSLIFLFPHPNFSPRTEYPLIRWLEKSGYDVSYQSGIDTDLGSFIDLLKHKVFISSGHDEYWSRKQRRNVELARDHGLNLMFLSGNEVFWKIRFESSPVGVSLSIFCVSHLISFFSFLFIQTEEEQQIEFAESCHPESAEFSLPFFSFPFHLPIYLFQEPIGLTRTVPWSATKKVNQEQKLILGRYFQELKYLF